MLRRPDRVPRSGRARRDRARSFRTRTVRDRFLVVRWVIVGIWAALLAVRVVVAVRSPGTDLAVFGVVESGAIAVGIVVVVVGIRHAVVTRRRRDDEALGLAIKRVDPTVWLVPATPTAELRQEVAAAKPDLVLGDRVTWAFGATEASLWELDERKATRVLVVRWSRMMHVGIEEVTHGRRRRAAAVAVHYVRADDRTAVATFFVRKGPGATSLLGRGPRLERLVMDLAAERIVA